MHKIIIPKKTKSARYAINCAYQDIEISLPFGYLYAVGREDYPHHNWKIFKTLGEAVKYANEQTKHGALSLILGLDGTMRTGYAYFLPCGKYDFFVTRKKWEEPETRLAPEHI